MEIDKVARVWIEYALKKAAIYLKDETTEEWLENAADLADNYDIEIIEVLLDGNAGFFPKKDNESDSITELRNKTINKRIEQLETFTKLNEILLNAYKDKRQNGS